MADFTMATTEKWTNRDGEREDRAAWHRIIAFGKFAEICGQYLKKGNRSILKEDFRPVHGKIEKKNKQSTTEKN